MRFWIGHVLLLLTCVVLPFTAALYVDTESEIRRAERAGGIAAKFASQNLESRLTLESQQGVHGAVALAQHIVDRDLAGELSKKAPTISPRREAAMQTMNDLLRAATPEGGFSWYLDEAGNVLARTDGSGADEKPQNLAGHPLFTQTQEGFALDGFWKDGDKVSIVGAAPLIIRGVAHGAVMIGKPIGAELVGALASSVRTDVTLTQGDRVVASTLDPGTAGELVSTIKDDLKVVSSGRLSKPLGHEYLPMLPLFIARDVAGFAYSSYAQRAPGGEEIRWIVSAPSGEDLRALAERQEMVLAGLISFFMLALLIGLVNHRVFVSPIDRITDHLAELQQGRGELEMPESKVSAPFRRMIRLINMTVQKIPARGFSTRPTSEPSPIGELGEIGSDRPSGSQPLHASALDLPAPPPPSVPSRGVTGDVITRGTTGDFTKDAARARANAAASGLMADPFEGGTGALADAVAGRSSKERTGAEPDESDAIAQAIASLEASTSNRASQPPAKSNNLTSSQSFPAPGGIPAAKTADTKPKKLSAADIRGKPSDSLAPAPSPFAPSASEMFRGSSGGYGPRSDEGEDIRTPIDSQLPAIQRAQTAARSGGSLSLGGPAGLGAAVPVEPEGFNPESTVVAPVADDLLRKSAARDETTSEHRALGERNSGDMTMVASVPANLLAQTMSNEDETEQSQDLAGLDPADHAHFKETYERFIEMRKRCGEGTSDLAFDRFLQKLAKNREGLIKKYNCRTVRFQVYEKDGKAALKATPVRAR